MLSYEKIVDAIKKAPKTWSPALLIEAAEVSIRKKCWRDGGLVKTVADMERRILKELNGNGQNALQQSKPKIITLCCGKCFKRFVLSEDNIHRRCGLEGCEGVLHKIA